jgi:hypothetical protein
MPSAPTIAVATSCGRCTSASDTKEAPSAKSGAAARAASSATRVFPTPPGPVTVSTRVDRRLIRSTTASTSLPRAIVRFGGTGSRSRRGVTGSSAPAATFSAASWTRIARWRSASREPGSIPSRSTSARRAAWKASSASAWRPARYSASMSCACSRSLHACSRVSCRSSATSPAWRPAQRSGLDPQLERGEAQLLQALALRRRERRPRELGERRTAPQLEGLAQRRGGSVGIAGLQRPAPGGHAVLEPVQVERRDGPASGSPTASSPARPRRRAPCAAHDVDANRLDGSGRRILPPEGERQLVGRHPRLACSSNTASTARGRPPATATTPHSPRTSSGPRIENRIAPRGRYRAAPSCVARRRAVDERGRRANGPFAELKPD